jgi:hypothetical protein
MQKSPARGPGSSLHPAELQLLNAYETALQPVVLDSVSYFT